MSSTYTAWNGEERSWPPPENWYRAADGRWWHPAYGPGDEPDVDLETGTEPEAEPDPPHVPTVVVDAPTRPPDRKPLVTAALIAAVVLLTAAVASIVVGGSPDDPATVPGNEPAAPDADDDSAQPSAASGSQGELDSTVDQFRRTMDEHGLSTDDLTDQQITGFASTYCAHAAGAEDRSAFDEVRQRAIAAAGSELTPIQLDLTITTAVAVFCPADSDRLGLSEDRSGP